MSKGEFEELTWEYLQTLDNQVATQGLKNHATFLKWQLILLSKLGLLRAPK